MAIEGLRHATILSIMSEIGSDGFTKFATAKQFTSWLRLAPNNKISGGKILSNKVPKGSNRLNCITKCSQCHWEFKGYSFIRFLQKSFISKRPNCSYKCYCKKTWSYSMDYDCKKSTLSTAYSISLFR